MRPEAPPKNESEEKAGSPAHASDSMAMDIMQCTVLTVEPEDSVYKAIGIFAEEHVSGLPVVDNHRLVGIISEKDVLRLMYGAKFLPGAVKDYMTTTVQSFDVQASVTEIGECLLQNVFRRVVILRDNALAGVVSRSDLIRHGMRYLAPPAATDHDARQERTPLARDAMQCGLLTVRRQTPLHEAANILATRRITGLPVVDEALQLLGIITEKDVLRAIFAPESMGQTVADLMTEDVTCFEQTDSMFDVCSCLTNNDFRRVPILDQGRLVGLISRADIILYIHKNKSAVFGPML